MTGGRGSENGVSKDVWIYDAVHEEWSKGAPMLIARWLKLPIQWKYLQDWCHWPRLEIWDKFIRNIFPFPGRTLRSTTSCNTQNKVSSTPHSFSDHIWNILVNQVFLAMLAASRWHYHWYYVLSHRCLKAQTLIRHGLDCEKWSFSNDFSDIWKWWLHFVWLDIVCDTLTAWTSHQSKPER